MMKKKPPIRAFQLLLGWRKKKQGVSKQDSYALCGGHHTFYDDFKERTKVAPRRRRAGSSTCNLLCSELTKLFESR